MAPGRLLLLLAAALGAAPATAAPSLLVVVTDDMRRDDLAHMPNVQRLLAEAGTSFASYVSNVALCCPARVTMLRGQYSHNTGVLTNRSPGGGFEAAWRRGLERDTYATALEAAGYATGYFGKYLNGYPGPAGESYVPPGWSRFTVPVAGDGARGFDYVLMEPLPGYPELRYAAAYGETPDVYATDVLVARTAAFVEEAAAAGTPFLAVLATFAPHAPATPAPRHARLFESLVLPRAPGFSELDVSDKPAYIRRLPALRERARARLDRRHRARVRSLQAVDEGVALLVERLAALGRLDDTYVFFTSDNGFHLGEHRMGWGKQSPYEEDIGLPLVVRGPGVPAGATVDALAGNTDLAPTLAEIGGTKLAHEPDGRSLLPWLGGADATEPWRRAFLLDLWSGSTRGERAGKTRVPPFHGLRTRRHLYVEYATGERELYDLATDPSELENAIASADPELVAALSARVAALRTCAGARCRELEDLPLDGEAASRRTARERRGAQRPRFGPSRQAGDAGSASISTGIPVMKAWFESGS